MPPTTTTHDRAQRESQPVPFWKGEENVIKAFNDGALKSADFDAHGVLDLKPAMEPAALDTSNTPYGKQQKPDLLREPLARLDQTLKAALAAPAPKPTEATDAERKELEVENQDLKAENDELKTEIAFLNEHIKRMQSLLYDFSLLYTLEHARA